MIIYTPHKLWQGCPSDEHRHAEAALVEAKTLVGLESSWIRGGIISRT